MQISFYLSCLRYVRITDSVDQYFFSFNKFWEILCFIFSISNLKQSDPVFPSIIPSVFLELQFVTPFYSFLLHTNPFIFSILSKLHYGSYFSSPLVCLNIISLERPPLTTPFHLYSDRNYFIILSHFIVFVELSPYRNISLITYYPSSYQKRIPALEDQGLCFFSPSLISQHLAECFTRGRYLINVGLMKEQSTE